MTKNTNFLNRVEKAEERLGYKLPKDYLEFIEKYEDWDNGWATWFNLDDLTFASEYDIPNFIIVEEYPELLSEEDCQHIIPVLSDNDAYIVLDLRENGKGAFMVWSDEEEIGFKSKTFEQLIKKLKKEVKNRNDNFDYFNIEYCKN